MTYNSTSDLNKIPISLLNYYVVLYRTAQLITKHCKTKIRQICQKYVYIIGWIYIVKTHQHCL